MLDKKFKTSMKSTATIKLCFRSQDLVFLLYEIYILSLLLRRSEFEYLNSTKRTQKLL